MTGATNVLLLVLLCGLACYAARTLLAESVLFGPLRDAIDSWLTHRLLAGRSTWWLTPLASIACGFCVSWWLAIPISAVAVLAGGCSPWWWPLLYSGTVGMAHWLAKPR